jgi:hypothetical protein
MRFQWALACTLLLALHSSALARAGEHSKKALRIRVSGFDLADSGSDEEQQIVGELVSIDDHQLSLKVHGRGNPLVIPRTRIYLVEVGGKRRSEAGTGALFGFLAGAAAGALEASIERHSYFGPWILGGAGGAAGGLLGLSVGSSIRHTEWSVMPYSELCRSSAPTAQATTALDRLTRGSD